MKLIYYFRVVVASSFLCTHAVAGLKSKWMWGGVVVDFCTLNEEERKRHLLVVAEKVVDLY